RGISITILPVPHCAETSSGAAMLWAIHRVYKPGMAQMRAAKTGEHRAYLLKCKDILMFTGQLQPDDGSEALGAWLVVNVDNRAAAQAFLDADPFARAGMLASVTITRMRKGRWNAEIYDKITA